MEALEGIHLIKTINEFFKEHFMKNIVLYIIIILSFTVGVSTGALTVNALDSVQNEELITYLNDFFHIAHTHDINNLQIFKLSVANNMKQVILLWIFGITVVGIPFILILIGIKGFVTGFTVGFLIKSFNTNGLFFSIVSILPQSLIIVPCFIILGVISINFSLSTLKNNKKNKFRREDMKSRFIAYSSAVLMILIVLTLGSFIEAYITPVFIKSVISSFW